MGNAGVNTNRPRKVPSFRTGCVAKKGSSTWVGVPSPQPIVSPQYRGKTPVQGPVGQTGKGVLFLHTTRTKQTAVVCLHGRAGSRYAIGRPSPHGCIGIVFDTICIVAAETEKGCITPRG
jgi:hypothetical protein